MSLLLQSVGGAVLLLVVLAACESRKVDDSKATEAITVGRPAPLSPRAPNAYVGPDGKELRHPDGSLVRMPYFEGLASLAPPFEPDPPPTGDVSMYGAEIHHGEAHFGAKTSAEEIQIIQRIEADARRQLVSFSKRSDAIGERARFLLLSIAAERS